MNNKQTQNRSPKPNQAGASKIKQKQKQNRKGLKPATSSIPRSPANALASAYSVGQRTMRPKVASSGISCRIFHRELVLKVAMTAAYTVQKIQLNPGLPKSFPWLSYQAVGWETYRFNALRFQYRTRVGSTVGGSVILSPDYNSSEGNPVSEQVCSTYVGTAEDVSWKDINCNLLPEGMHALGPKKYVRSSSLSANQDIKTYDVGSMFIATVDGTPGPCGVLWVEYDITLSNPQTPSGGAGSSYQRFSTATGTQASVLNGFVDSSLALYATIAGNVLTFTMAGRFDVDLFIQAGGAITATNAVVAGGGIIIDYGGVVGSTLPRTEEVFVIDAIVGTTITYNYTFAGNAIVDIFIAPIMVRTPFTG